MEARFSKNLINEIYYIKWKVLYLQISLNLWYWTNKCHYIEFGINKIIVCTYRLVHLTNSTLV